MRGPRIPMLDVEEARRVAVEARVHEGVAGLNIFRVLLRHPRLARQVNNLLGLLLLEGKLDARLRELVIMRIGWVTGSAYEWGQHWKFGQAFGVPAEDLAAVRDWRRHEGFGPAERAVLAATDEVLATGEVSPATWSECEAHVGGTEELLELLACIGGWSMISVMLRTLEVPLDDDLELWAPDGVGPEGRGR